MNMSSNTELKIVADENIPYALEAFSLLGSVTLLKGRDITANDLQQADILLVRSVTRVNQALLDGTSVKFVASATAGFNHIDLEYLQLQNIGFARAPGSNATSAAEYVLAGICYWSLQHQINLQNISVGIIGYGNVGSRVKRLCDAMGMRCIANDPPLQEQGMAELNSIDAALACDIVTLHLPLSLQGKHATSQLLNKQRITQLEPNTLFINASRGEVVDETALLERMQIQNDLSLILDVWENEPAISLEMLRYTLIGTPHIAGYSLDGKIRGTEMIYQACCKFLDKQPRWSVAEVDFGKQQKYDFSKFTHNDHRKAILEAYDIFADNNRLKCLLDDRTLDVGKYFDDLRKNYPARREYS